MTMYVFTDGEPDGEGRERIQLFHFQPHLLSPERLAQGTEVPRELADPPPHGENESATAWLTPEGQLVWDIEEVAPEPGDPPPDPLDDGHHDPPVGAPDA